MDDVKRHVLVRALRVERIRIGQDLASAPRKNKKLYASIVSEVDACDALLDEFDKESKHETRKNPNPKPNVPQRGVPRKNAVVGSHVPATRGKARRT